MKRKLLAFTLGVAMVFVFFGVACGGEQGGSNVDVSNEQFSSSSEDISVPEIGENSSGTNNSVEISVGGSEDISAPEIGETLLASELFPWIKTLTVESVLSVEREEYISVPGALTNVTQSTEKEDIEIILAYLKSLNVTAISGSEGQVEGGGGVQITFITSSEMYTARESNGNFYVDGQYYRLNESVPALSTMVYHRFVYGFGTSTLYIDNVEMKDYGNLANAILFMKKETVEDFNYTGYELDFDGGILIISDKKTFGFAHWGDKTNISVYTIVGETDFSQIFADYPLCE